MASELNNSPKGDKKQCGRISLKSEWDTWHLKDTVDLISSKNTLSQLENQSLHQFGQQRHKPSKRLLFIISLQVIRSLIWCFWKTRKRNHLKIHACGRNFPIRKSFYWARKNNTLNWFVSICVYTYNIAINVDSFSNFIGSCNALSALCISPSRLKKVVFEPPFINSGKTSSRVQTLHLFTFTWRAHFNGFRSTLIVEHYRTVRIQLRYWKRRYF